MGDLELNPRLTSPLREAISRSGLPHLWSSAAPLSGGRGSARLLELDGSPFVVKQERRGGRVAAAVPDRFLFKGPFLREWRLGLHLAERHLAPEPVAMQTEGPPCLFRVFNMTRAILPGRSLSELWMEGGLDGASLEHVGEAVASLHRAGVIHGDLNAGNLLFGPGPIPLLLDLRHSRWTISEPSPAERLHNLLRLCRSLHKLRTLHRLEWPKEPWAALLSGYWRGWGCEESWSSKFLATAERGFPLRSLFW